VGSNVSSGTTAASFGTLLRLHRRRMGLTQEALGERAGFSVEYIKKLEGGSRRPSAGSVDVLAHTLQLEPGELERFRAARTGGAFNVQRATLVEFEAGLTGTRDESDRPAVAPPVSSAESAWRPVGEASSQTAPAVTLEAPAPRHPVGPTEERRLVTALFCDLAGLTSFSETLDPEDLRDIQTTYLSAMTRQIERYGGRIDSYAGDTVLALFGMHVAHEDDPERAVLCALGMQQAMAQVTEEIEERFGSRVEERAGIRVGINTGEVVSGPRTGSAWEGIGASGAAINTADRIQASAVPDEILVGQETMHLTRRRIRYGEARELSLKGRASPLLVFPALGVNQSIEGLWQAVHEILPPAPFVGRGREMEILGGLWGRARAGEGQLVSIVGEPGVGKSRLIAEYVSRAVAGGLRGDEPRAAAIDGPDVRILQARCLSYGQGVSLWLIADLLRSIFSVGEDDPLDTVRERLDTAVLALLTQEDQETRLEARDVLGEVLGLQPSDSMVTRAGAEVRRRALVRSLRGVLSGRSLCRPTILVLQDLHWIDSASNEVLGQVAVDVPGLCLLVVVAQREGWTGPWSEWGWPERLTLRPLPENEAAALAETVLGNVPLSTELEQYLAERAGGNPFFVEELARSLKENGGLRDQDGCLDLVPDVAQRLPSTLAEVLQARLDRLDPPVKTVVQVGSVIGRSFAVRLLAEVVGEAQSTLEAPLRALQQAEIAFPRGYSPGSQAGEMEYSFKHVTMREAAYNTLVRKRRQELHLQTARAIAALYPSDEYVETIAYHYARTDADAEAAEWLEKAGNRAAGIFANETAEAHYRGAIDRLSKLNAAEDASRVGEKLGDLLLLQSRYEEARTMYEEAQTGIPAGERVWLARAQRKIGDVWAAQRSFLEEALAAWDGAEAALGDKPAAADPTWWREWLNIQLGRMEQFYYHGRVDELVDLVERSRPVVETCATGRQGCRFFGNLLLLYLRRDAYTPDDETLAYARKAVEGAETLGDIGQMAWPLFLLGFALLWHGDLGEGEETMLRALELAERTGDAPAQSMCTTYLTVLYRKRGDVKRVRDWNARSLEAALAAKRTEYVAMAAANNAWLGLKEGDLPAAESQARSAVADWQSLSASYPYMFWWAGVWILIDVEVRQDRIAEAIDHARMLFGPDQARVPDPIATQLHAAINAWDRDDEKNTREDLAESLRLAQEMAYL
jgi:class 3 adenylate cyclase/tetratricopeptide (TPR) repeat protein